MEKTEQNQYITVESADTQTESISADSAVSAVEFGESFEVSDAPIERGPYNVEALTAELLTLISQASPNYVAAVYDYLRELSVLEAIEPPKNNKTKRR